MTPPKVSPPPPAAPPPAPALPAKPPARKSGARKLGVPLAISGITALLLSGGFLLQRQAAAQVNSHALASEPRAVTVVEAKAGAYQKTRTYVGTLLPWLEAKLGPQLTAAMVETVHVRPGDVVRRGQVLATLDCRNATASNQAITAQAQALRARQLAFAREAERIQGLVDGGYVSLNEAEQKQASALSNEAQLSALLAQQQGKSLEVNDCVLRAPFDGEVASRLADPGTFVRPGGVVLTVVDRHKVRLAFDVPESDSAAVSAGGQISLELLARGTQQKATVSRVSPFADLHTRALKAEADLDNADRSIPVGTTAEVTVAFGSPEPALEIPLSAARIRGTTATVMVVENDVAEKRELEVLGESGKTLFVSPSMPAGTRVVTFGRAQLKPKEKVVSRLESVSAPGPKSGGAR